MTKEHPTVKERVQADGVGMRWIRTAAVTITSVSAACGVIGAVVVWLALPRLDLWANEVIDGATAELQQATKSNAAHLDRIDHAVESLAASVNQVSVSLIEQGLPSWRFSLPDTSISDGRIGGRVTITAAGYKLRECGIPRVDLYFINGGGTYHRFVNTSLLTQNSRGVAFPADANRLQEVSYTAEIPDNDNVHPGRGRGFIAVTYPDTCPTIQEVVAGPLQFRILPNG